MNKEKLYSQITRRDHDQQEIGNAYEMGELPHRSQDGELGNMVLTYSRVGSVKISAKFEDFELRHCRAVKSIRYNKHVYNGVYHPVDDSSYFFIKMNKEGRFIFGDDPYKDKKLSIIKDLLKEEFMIFVEKLNDILELSNLKRISRGNKLKKVIVLLILCLLILLLSLNVFLFSFRFFLWLLSMKIANEAITFLGNDISTYLICFFCIAGIWTVYTFYRYYRGKDKYIQFTYLHLKRHEIQSEVEYWNSSIFHPLNMKVILADTLDYLMVFYENRYRVELCNHFIT